MNCELTKEESTFFGESLDFLSAALKLRTEKGLTTRLSEYSPTEVSKVTVRRKTHLHEIGGSGGIPVLYLGGEKIPRRNRTQKTHACLKRTAKKKNPIARKH